MADREIVKREVIPFLYRQEEEVRTVTDAEGQTWFVLADICKVLQIQNPTVARRPLSDDKVGRTRLADQRSDVLLVTEGGMWRVVMRSNRPEAAAFQDWIADTVLPSIRKTGEYQTQARILEVGQTVAAAVLAFRRKVADTNAALDKPQEAQAALSTARHVLDTLPDQFEVDVRAILSRAAWQYVKNELERQERSLRTGIPYSPLPVPETFSTDPPEDED